MLSLLLIFFPILFYSQAILPPSKASTSFSSILSSSPSSSSPSSSSPCSHLAFCSNHGHCINNQCLCDQDWGYLDCSIQLNPPSSPKNLKSFRFISILDKNSSLENEILNSTDTLFSNKTSLEEQNASIIKEEIILTNSDIPSPKCPFCENQGICDSLTGKCICLEPFTGPNCSLLLFPLPISVLPPPAPPSPSCFCLYGACINDICHCISTYTGPHCTQLTCPNSCSSHGYCSPSFVCICDPGYSGEDCSDIVSQFTSSSLLPSSSSSSTSSSSLFSSSSKNSSSNEVNTTLVHNSSISSSSSSSYSPSLLFLLPPSYLPCGPHGSLENNVCVCETGWEGNKCEFLLCEGGCSSHGLCINGTCYCKHPYTGKNCQTKRISPIPSSSPLSSSPLPLSPLPSSSSSSSISHPLPSSLLPSPPSSPSPSPSPSSSLPLLSSSLPPLPFSFSPPPSPLLCQGLFINSTCFCPEGWTGSDCTIKTCPNACSFRGTCLKNGSCTCQRGYRGEDCAEKYIKNGYFTKTGTVKCTPPYSGSFCSRKNCEPKCKNGKCVNGTCRCKKGWVGMTCEEKDCGACLNGRCENDICVCKKGWKGKDCSEKLCVEDCSNHGICQNDGRCACNLGYTGLACEVSIFNLTCSYHGVFREGACICEEGWLGEFCNEKKNVQTEQIEFCPKNCSQNGICSGPPEYKCICNLGFIGECCDLKIDNEKLECEKGCNEHGKCLMNKCICDGNFKGVGCEKEIFSVKEIQCRSKCVKTCLEKEKFHECLSFCNLNCDKQGN